MKRFWVLAAVFVLLVTLFVTSTPVFAQGGRTAFGEPVTVRSGETVNGDLVALGGPVTIERGGEVRGDVIAFGGPITMAGRVEGDVMAWGGPIDLQETASV